MLALSAYMCQYIPMYVESVPNRNSPPAILLRQSSREGNKIRKRTLANLSSWSPAHIESLRRLLRGEVLIRPSNNSRSLARCRTDTWPPCSARCIASAYISTLRRQPPPSAT